MPDRRFLTRVALQDYKSIGECDVSPEQLTVLVGANGSGKSNFLDALRLISDSLRSSLEQALSDRGGLDEVRRYAPERPNCFGIRAECRLADASVRYAFAVGAGDSGALEVQREDCLVTPHDRRKRHAFYSVRSGRVVESSVPDRPKAPTDELYLAQVSRIREFLPVYQALSGMRFYSLNPQAIRHTQPLRHGEASFLESDGSNIANVLHYLEKRSPDCKQRIEEYLTFVVPGLAGIGSKSQGAAETVEFRQRIAGSEQPWRCLAKNMSDGTLRALGILVALYQCGARDEAAPRLVAIEEPEMAVHPAVAGGVLAECLVDAARQAQVIVTSHGSDFLDDAGIADESIFVAVAEGGKARIGPMSDIDRSIVRDRLYTAGELLRLNQLQLNPTFAESRLPEFSVFDCKP